MSEFGPAGSQKLLSYVSGWMSCLAWLAGQASGPFLTATLVQVMVQVNVPDREFAAWQYTLLMLGFILTLIFFNTWAAPIMPVLQACALVFYVVGFLIIIITLWVMSPKASAKDVFLTFTNNSGWSMGATILLNQVNSLYCILGSDTGVHISEEVGDASLTMPRAMWFSYWYLLFHPHSSSALTARQ